MRHLKAIGIGTLIGLALLFLVMGPTPQFLGGPTPFLAVIAMWVVCTFGVVLIPFLLFAWLVGLLVLATLEIGRPVSPSGEPPAEQS